MYIKFIGPLNCLGGWVGQLLPIFIDRVYKYITGNAWVSALPKKAR